MERRLRRFFFISALSIIITLVLAFILVLIPYGKYVGMSVIINLFLMPFTMTYGFLVYSNLKSLKGEIAFAPTSGQKARFIVVAIIGVLLTPALLFSMVFFKSNSAEKKRATLFAKQTSYKFNAG